LPCFWFEQRVGVLPSFGSFTGGAEVSPGRKSQVLVVAEEQVLRLPESPRSAFTLGI
jgi:hypothetical protein